ncbi:MarR family transcriptional regulator [Streptomyces rubradiris]|uniref:MarR family winged helix-turn-helix transcriptional regulator n=1 Tax=Streptomyces rubradiris TaxID=285531 RepID=UPI0033E436A9
MEPRSSSSALNRAQREFSRLEPRIPAAGTVTGRHLNHLGARLASDHEVAWWQAMEKLRERFERAMAQQLARLGLSGSMYLALEQLALNAGELCIAEVAEKIRLSPSSTSRVVDRLVREGLAVRQPGVDDRRSVHAAATEQGRTLYEAARPAYRAALAQALDESWYAADSADERRPPRRRLAAAGA